MTLSTERERGPHPRREGADFYGANLHLPCLGDDLPEFDNQGVSPLFYDVGILAGESLPLRREQCRLFRKYPFNFGPGQLNSISKHGYLVLIQLLVLTIHLETTPYFSGESTAEKS